MLKQAEQGSGAGRAGRAGRAGKAGRAGRQNGRARHFAIRVHHSKTMADLLPNGSFEHFSWCRSTCKVAYHPVGHLASSQRTSFTCKVAYRPAGHFASTRRASSGRPGRPGRPGRQGRPGSRGGPGGQAGQCRQNTVWHISVCGE